MAAASARYERPRQVGAQDAIGAAIENARKKRVIEVWPENWPAWCLFGRMETQWRSPGMSGPVVGLDYNVLLRFLDRMDLSKSDYDQMLNDISAMEEAAMSEIYASS
jgi:hypothetical protein